jgi:RNA 3'-phosphate cyclase
MGIQIDARLVKRGYYPKGGGEAIITIHPIKKLTYLQLDRKQSFKKINGKISIANLPDHISKRMKHAAIKEAVKHNIRCYIEIDKTIAFSPGIGITVWTNSNQTVLGSTGLGEKGVTADDIGKQSAYSLIQDITKGATIDIFALDQILPYMVLAQNESTCLVRKLSTHTKTNMWLLHQFFDVEFEEHNYNEIIKLIVR